MISERWTDDLGEVDLRRRALSQATHLLCSLLIPFPFALPDATLQAHLAHLTTLAHRCMPVPRAADVDAAGSYQCSSVDSGLLPQLCPHLCHDTASLIWQVDSGLLPQLWASANAVLRRQSADGAELVLGADGLVHSERLQVRDRTLLMISARSTYDLGEVDFCSRLQVRDRTLLMISASLTYDGGHFFCRSGCCGPCGTRRRPTCCCSSCRCEVWLQMWLQMWLQIAGECYILSRRVFTYGGGRSPSAALPTAAQALRHV